MEKSNLYVWSTLSFKIRFSLVKSRLRRQVLTLLVRVYPNALYLQEIARNINARPDQIIGAIRGLSSRYEPSLSLISLGLVTIVENDSSKKIRNLYRATKLGCDVVHKAQLTKEHHMVYP